ncbi:hypothetical protein [Streptomyces sp. CC210A]|uniref:hypothetical protein n=1 Tax=Streptomyces sp. CC210A TaxID=2898184 RepID=UPI001F477F8A|nr:hypothetical protein [Streptomyces sp. CC210A]
MILDPAKAACNSPANGSASHCALSGGLDPVMPPAERLKVGFSMVVTGLDVVHVRGDFRTPHAILILGHASISVSSEDTSPDLCPVLRQTLSSV